MYPHLPHFLYVEIGGFGGKILQLFLFGFHLYMEELCTVMFRGMTSARLKEISSFLTSTAQKNCRNGRNFVVP